MRRPVVWIASCWVIGAYMSLTDQPKGLLISGMILLIMWLIATAWHAKSRIACLTTIIVISISMSYNLWYDAKNVSQIATLAEHEDQLLQREITFKGTIVSPIQLDGDRVSFVTDVDKERLQIVIRLSRMIDQETVMQWKRGDKVQMTGELDKPGEARNFGMFEYGQYLYHQRIHWIVNITGLEQVVVYSESRGWSKYTLFRWTDEVRGSLSKRIDAIFSEHYRGFLKSMLIGVRDEIDAEQFQQFAHIGMSHILAISGLHVGIFTAGCIWILRRMGLTREAYLMVAIGLLPCYILLSGAAPSVIRAGCMGMIALYALKRNMLKDGLSIISIVGVLMLIWNPYYLFYISFQFSFLVTLGLIIFVPWLNKLWPIQSISIKSALSVTTVAELFSFPLSVYYFNYYSLLSWGANLFLVPLASLLIIPLAMSALLLSFIHISIGSFIAKAVEVTSFVLVYCIEQLNAIESMLTIWPSPSHLWIFAYFSLLSIILWCVSVNGVAHKFSSRRLPLLLSMLVMAVLLFQGYSPNYFDRAGYVQFLDVGQGDAILIQTPSRKTILIDGGGTQRFTRTGEEWKARKEPYEVGKDLLVPLLKKRGIQQIDYIIISHHHVDHIGGLQAVVDNIPVKRIIFNGSLRDHTDVMQLFQTAINRNIPLHMAEQGRGIQVDDNTHLTFLYPTEQAHFKYIEEQNRVSVVVLMQMYESSFLFTGDLERREEHIVLSDLLNQSSGEHAHQHIDVLKVAHHGSRTSTSVEWLDYWQPQTAIIPVGRYNTYGHPHPHVIQRLEEYDIDVYRNDHHGEVKFILESERGFAIKPKLK